MLQEYEKQKHWRPIENLCKSTILQPEHLYSSQVEGTFSTYGEKRIKIGIYAYTDLHKYKINNMEFWRVSTSSDSLQTNSSYKRQQQKIYIM